jgi:hypothetical protein
MVACRSAERPFAAREADGFLEVRVERPSPNREWSPSTVSDESPVTKMPECEGHMWPAHCGHPGQLDMGRVYNELVSVPFRFRTLRCKL